MFDPILLRAPYDLCGEIFKPGCPRSESLKKILKGG
jgi:hypothetical protein